MEEVEGVAGILMVGVYEAQEEVRRRGDALGVGVNPRDGVLFCSERVGEKEKRGVGVGNLLRDGGSLGDTTGVRVMEGGRVVVGEIV